MFHCATDRDATAAGVTEVTDTYETYMLTYNYTIALT
jgi:hypothetical protein